ncbi:hypothetical protein [Streptacidiphilus melanogenes]|uniref:hypothetical protein n=1 Tax=Streptacidiphilus melanogenes TaxID=411235 RepID=UPI00126A4164|nr:hypothetical protein [Streptacidiphilus melanogenes]
MTKYFVNVCLPPTAPEDVRAALDAAMAPFDVNNPEGGNPDGEWDWWRIDAGDEERFMVRPKFAGDPRLVHQATHPNGKPRDRLPHRCDGGPVGLLDFAATRAAATARAEVRFRAEQHEFGRLAAHHPPAEPRIAFWRRHRADPHAYPLAQAVTDHQAQPLVRALSNPSALPYPNLRLATHVLAPDVDPIAHFTRDLRADLRRAAAVALMAYALLTLDGQWTEAAGPGPFTDLLPEEDPATGFARQTGNYLESLDADCLVVRLLCHC